MATLEMDIPVKPSMTVHLSLAAIMLRVSTKLTVIDAFAQPPTKALSVNTR